MNGKKLRAEPSPEARDAYARGFDAGNYANAYVTTDLDSAWEVDVEDGDIHDRYRATPECAEAFRAGYVLGFFSSYEEREIEFDQPQHLDEYRAASAKWEMRRE